MLFYMFNFIYCDDSLYLSFAHAPFSSYQSMSHIYHKR